MYRVAKLAFAVALTSLALAHASPLDAHHTFVTRYDGAKKITVSGTVSAVSYSNPHIHFTLEAADGTSWAIETEGIAVLQKHGVTRTVLTEGAKATVTGWRARDGSASLGLSTISFAKGLTASIRGTAR